MGKSVRASKAEIRRHMQSLRKAMPSPENLEKSRAIAQRVLLLEAYQKAGTLLVYRALPEEVQTADLIEKALEEGKQVCVPQLVEGQENLVIVRWPETEENWIEGPFGILQPQTGSTLEISALKLDLVLTPGLAFDTNGGRLGYGKGYFDRLFASTRSDCFRLGLAFEYQVIKEVPMESNDRALNGVITEDRTLPCAP